MHRSVVYSTVQYELVSIMIPSHVIRYRILPSIKRIDESSSTQPARAMTANSLMCGRAGFLQNVSLIDPLILDHVCLVLGSITGKSPSIGVSSPTLLTRESNNVPPTTGNEKINRCTSYNPGHARVSVLCWLLAPEIQFARIRLECSVHATSNVRA